MVKTTRGFSLVELLAVIAIVAILFGITVPIINRVVRSSHNTTCQANLRQLYTAINLYATDNGRYPPSAQESPSYITWYMYLLGQTNNGVSIGPKYLDSGEALGCPEGHFSKTPTVPRWEVSYGITSLPVWIAGGRTDSIPSFFTYKIHQRSEWPLIMDADYQRIFSLDNPTEDATNRERFKERHGDKANVMMADGHIEQVSYGDKRWSQANLNQNNLYDR